MTSRVRFGSSLVKFVKKGFAFCSGSVTTGFRFVSGSRNVWFGSVIK